MRQLKRSLFLCFLLCLTTLVWAAEEEAQTLLVMGDSLSAGYGIDLDQSWVSLLQARLEDQGEPIQVINASVSGETSRGGAKRLGPLLERYKPFLVVIELGGNDGLRGQPLGTMRENLGRMIEQSLAANAEVLLIGMQIPPNYGKRYASEFAQVYPALAKKYEVPLVSFLLEGVATNEEAMQRDGIHPKATAQPKILDNVWPTLKPLLTE